MAKKDTIIGAIITYFEGCPLIAAEDKDNINADNLAETVADYCIETVPCNPIIKTYVDGSAVKQYLFVFASREAFGDLNDNLSNSAFFEQIADWIEAQAEQGQLPVLPKGLEAQRLQVMTNGYVMDNDETKARYQIQCRLKYYQPAKS